MYNDGPPFGPVVNGTQIVIFWEYRPSKPAAYAFMAIFALATLGHLVYFFWLRAWHFLPFLLGGISEIFGYFGRARASDNPVGLGPWIQQNMLLLVAPPFLAATVYMSLGRIIIALDASRYAMISLRWMTKIYVLLDFGAIVSQLVGTILPASGSASAIALSKKIVLGGLLVQLIALCVFILNAWQVHHRLRRDGRDPLPSVNWSYHFYASEMNTVFLIVRSVIRTVEYLQGSETGFVAKHEIFIYLFDAVPMATIMVVLLVLHPGRLIRDAHRIQGEKGRDTGSESYAMLERG